jgi:WD40 repeat protein
MHRTVLVTAIVIGLHALAATAQRGVAQDQAHSAVVSLDWLDPSDIPPAERYDWQPPELVAVLGCHALKHWSYINMLAISADGRFLATGGPDGWMRVWDVESRRELAAIDTHEVSNFAPPLVFAPDAKTLIYQTQGKWVFWNVETKGEIMRFAQTDHHGVRLRDYFFEPKDQFAVRAGSFATIKLPPLRDFIFSELPRMHVVPLIAQESALFWTPAAHSRTGAPLAKAIAKTQHRCYAVSGDARLLAVAYAGIDAEMPGQVEVWDTTSVPPQIVTTLSSKHELKRLAFDGAGDLLAANTILDTFQVWRLSAKRSEPQYAFDKREQSIGSFAFLADEPRLLFGRVDGTIWDWSLNDPTPKRVSAEAGDRSNWAIPKVAPHCGRIVWLRGNAASLGRWTDGQGAHDVDDLAAMNLRGSVKSLAFSPDGRRLAVGGDWYTNTVEVWDLSRADGKPVPTSTKLLNAGHSVVFTPDGSTLGVATDRLKTFDMKGETATLTGTFWTDERRSPESLKSSADGKTFAFEMIAGGGGTATELLDVTTPHGVDAHGKLHQHLKRARSTRLGGVDFSRDNRWLAVAGSNWNDGTLELWDLDKPEPVLRHRISTEKYQLRHVTFSPDSKLLVAAQRHTVKVWELRDDGPHAVATFSHPRRIGDSIAFSPDSRLIASSSWKGDVVAWDVATKNVHWTCRLPGMVASLAFAPDGKHLATGNGNGTVYILRLPPMP